MKPQPRSRLAPFAGPPEWLRRRLGRIAEPAVTLTDYGLAIEGLCCAVILARNTRRDSELYPLGSIFFGATALAALTGGTFHGCFPDKRHPLHQRLWTTTLLALGTSSAAAWGIAARLAFAPRQARLVTTLGAGAYGIYGAVVLNGRQQFIVAVVGYLPAILFLLGALARRYARSRERAAALGLAGVGLTLIATGVQQGKLTIHPRFCDHNTLYHLLMGLALPLFCAGLRDMETAPATGQTD